MAPIPKRPPPTSSTLRRNNYVAIVGDSIAAGAGIGSNTRFFDLLCGMTNGRAFPLFNAGIGGQLIAEVMARLDTDVIARNKGGIEPAFPRPRYCIVEAGTNDINNNHTLSQMQADYLPGIKQLIAAGIEPIIFSVPPKGKSGASNTQKQLTSRFNAYLHALATANGLGFLDVYAALSDPVDGLYVNALQIDQIHPNWAGVRAVATALASDLAAMLPPGKVFLDRETSRTIAANLLTNPQFLTDTDSDGVADGWLKTGVGGTITTSLVADGSTGRNWQRTAVASAPSSFSIFQAIDSAYWVPGDVLQVSCRVSTANLETASGRFFIRLDFTGGTPSNWYLYDNFGGDVTDVLFSQWLRVPTGTTNMAIRWGWENGTGTFDIAEPQVINRTQLGLP